MEVTKANLELADKVQAILDENRRKAVAMVDMWESNTITAIFKQTRRSVSWSVQEIKAAANTLEALVLERIGDMYR